MFNTIICGDRGWDVGRIASNDSIKYIFLRNVLFMAQQCFKYFNFSNSNTNFKGLEKPSDEDKRAKGKSGRVLSFRQNTHKAQARPVTNGQRTDTVGTRAGDFCRRRARAQSEESWRVVLNEKFIILVYYSSSVET